MKFFHISKSHPTRCLIQSNFLSFRKFTELPIPSTKQRNRKWRVSLQIVWSKGTAFKTFWTTFVKCIFLRILSVLSLIILKQKIKWKFNSQKYRMGHLTFRIWISYKKKNLWIFFQKYGFIRKIEPSHLRMKHNIIEMTPTASLTVPHSIYPIFQYIFDCLGKRSISSISKIIAIGDQKIQTSSLRSRYTHNEWLFCVNFGAVASLGHCSSKMSKEPSLRSMASVTVPCSTNFCFQNLKRMSWTTFGINRTGPLTTQPT